MNVLPLTEGRAPAWDGYVRQAADGLPQHLAGWQQVLRRSYGYATPFLMAQVDERVVGVLPLFIVRSPLLGCRATTLPGGLCADSAEVAAALLARGSAVARAAGARQLRLHDSRHRWPALSASAPTHATWLLSLRGGADALWQRLDGNVRRQVRLARRNGLHVEVDRTGARADLFYELFSRFTHSVGTPLFARSFLEHVIAALPGSFSIAVVYRGAQPLGAYFQLHLARSTHGLWGATLREHLQLRPVYLAYWEIIADAAARDHTLLDMGRSPLGSTAAAFKQQWGAQPLPLFQQSLSLNGRPADPSSNRSYALIQRLWPRLPLPVAQFLGPRLRHHVPFG